MAWEVITRKDDSYDSPYYEYHIICYPYGKKAGPERICEPCNKFYAQRIVQCVNNFDELVKALKGLTHRAECMTQSHQCVEHKGGDCCDLSYADLSYALDAIMRAKQALSNATKEPQERR